MSKLRRLWISGVRNFDENEEAVIHFARPLTLILGPNGTGKTTIIEALKFVATGDFPPGSDRGKFFVRDPTLSENSAMKGIVKAEIIDNKKNNYTLCRALECTKTSAGFKLRTLDSTLTRRDYETKKVHSTTNRCANVDMEIALALGVSKPILNYVIFCHQEDLNWPLEDGKKLKEKFDEIFDSSKYNKALEHIAKYIKELAEDIRVMKVEEQVLAKAVAGANEIKAKLDTEKQRLSNSEEKIHQINTTLQPLIKRLRELEEQDNNYNYIVNQKDRKKLEYEMSVKQAKQLKERVKNIFEGSLEELKSAIESYDDVLFSKSADIAEITDKLKSINSQEAKTLKLLAEERIVVGSLRQQAKDHQNRIVLRNKTLCDALCAIDPGSDEYLDPDLSATKATAFMKRLEKIVHDLEHELKESRREKEHEERKLQKDIDVLRSTRSKIESEMSVKDAEVTRIRKELATISMQISQVGVTENKLNSVESQLEIANKNIENLTKSLNVESVKTEILEKINSRDSLEMKLNKCDEDLTLLHKQSSLQAELELHKSALISKTEELLNLKQNHVDDIKIFLNVNTLPDINLKDCLDRTQQTLADELKRITLEIQKEQQRTTSLETTLKHKEMEMKKKVGELESDKIKISSFCDYKEFDEKLLLESTKVKDLQNRRGMFAYEDVAFKEYLNQLKQKKPCCPLCHRDFAEEKKLKDLIKEMEYKMVNHPDRLKQCELELKEQQAKYDTMLQLKPTVEKIIIFEQIGLKKLQEDIEEIQQHLKQSREQIKILEASKVKPEQKLVIYKKVVNDVMRWDQCTDEIRKLNRTIDEVQARLTDAGIEGSYTIQELQELRESLKLSLKHTQDNIDNMQLTINTQNEKVQKARDARNKLYEEQLRIRSDMQKMKQLQSKQEELLAKEVSLVESIDELRQKLDVATTDLDAAMLVLENTKRDNWTKLEHSRDTVMAGARHLNELRKIQTELDTYIERNIADTLANTELKVNKFQKELEELSSRKAASEETLAELKKDISQQETRKRELSDNMTLRQAQDNVQKLEEEYRRIQEKIDSDSARKVQEELQQLQKEEEKYIGEKNVVIGTQGEMRRAIRQYEEELKKESNRLAQRNYKNKCIELKVLEHTIKDLREYSKALDSAMIEYHEERMTTLNKIMHRLWRYTYKGPDTSSIQIRTDHTQGVGESRRVYNYRLVQIKHGNEMGMKGRCSAGQKVLASIIIRLALAETFCKDCGILALDEPTTNLDEENANSLADALSNVVRLRSQCQKNFQLIIISHDEQFLRKLSLLDHETRFYELYRKPNGLTSIKLCHLKENAALAMDPIKEEVIAASDNENENDDRSNTESSKSTNIHISNKRFNRDSDDEEQRKDRPAKKRFVLAK